MATPNSFQQSAFQQPGNRWSPPVFHSFQQSAFQIGNRFNGGVVPPGRLGSTSPILWRIGFKSIQTKIAFIGGTIPEVDK